MNGKNIRAALSAALSITALAGLATTIGTGQAQADGCTAVQVISARGTGEPLGFAPQLGTVVGNPVYNAINKKLTASSSPYRVDYPASATQLNSISLGNTDLVNHIIEQATSCPNQSFVLVGYSQGAFVVENSLGVPTYTSWGSKIIPGWVEPKIKAVLLFGNPIGANGGRVTGTYAARTLDICHDGDPVCDPNGNNVNQHTNYGQDAGRAAQFAVDRL
ncbi:cutinase family protein [Nocardia sp. NPDC058705]|uniref:cutinase family protein n=1 Tax=Nocardia sp. NPDC058705 TaxID=3346609 RepID=UPI00367864DC